MPVASSDVERALRESFAAVLRPAGFTRRGRNWWAHRSGDSAPESGAPDPNEVSLVISTASVPAWPADVIGITRASFSVQIGLATAAALAFALGDDERGRQLLDGPAGDNLARSSTLRAEIDAVIGGGRVQWRDVDAEHERYRAEDRPRREERARRRAARAQRSDR